MEYVIRFLLGGVVVSVFSVLGNLVRPRTFAGIFGAAPTVALATLALAFAAGEAEKVSIEGRSMFAGALALGLYSLLTCHLLLKKNWSSLPAAIFAYVFWFAAALGLYFTLLRCPL